MCMYQATTLDGAQSEVLVCHTVATPLATGPRVNVDNEADNYWLCTIWLRKSRLGKPNVCMCATLEGSATGDIRQMSFD